MNQKAMTVERLQEICAAYGHDPQLWPLQERVEAKALVATSAEARSVLDDAARLDQWLDSEPALASSPELRNRILATAPASTARNTSAFPAWLASFFTASWEGSGGWRYAIPALLVALVLGMALGGNAAPDTLDQSDLMQLALFQNDLDGY